MSRIYVASSWKNELQQAAINRLRAEGHDVYDFKRPHPTAQQLFDGRRVGNLGFQWSDIDHQWEKWTTQRYREALTHPVAQDGFRRDFTAMQACDLCVLVLPCGRSAHSEAGWFSGAGKPVYVLAQNPEPPELMYLLFTRIVDNFDDLITEIGPIRFNPVET